MKSIKKITVFYTDGTFEDIEKPQTIDLGKINSPSYQYGPTTPAVNPIVNPSWWGGMPVSTAATPNPNTYSPQPLGSAQLSTTGIQALTSAQIASFTVTDSAIASFPDRSQW